MQLSNEDDPLNGLARYSIHTVVSHRAYNVARTWEQKRQPHAPTSIDIVSRCRMRNVNGLLNSIRVYSLRTVHRCLRRFDFVQPSEVIGSLHPRIFSITLDCVGRTRIFRRDRPHQRAFAIKAAARVTRARGSPELDAVCSSNTNLVFRVEILVLSWMTVGNFIYMKLRVWSSTSHLYLKENEQNLTCMLKR